MEQKFADACAQALLGFRRSQLPGAFVPAHRRSAIRLSDPWDYGSLAERLLPLLRRQSCEILVPAVLGVGNRHLGAGAVLAIAALGREWMLAKTRRTAGA